MSLFATVYIASSTSPLEVLSLFLGTPQTEARVQVAGGVLVAKVVEPPHFLHERLGFTPTIQIFADIDKQQAPKARATLVEGINRLLDETDRDLALVYLDDIVVLRRGGTERCRLDYADYRPTATLVPLIPDYEDE